MNNTSSEKIINLQKDANGGNPDSQMTLAMCYFSGYDVKKDNVKALKWLHKAARNGNVSAMYWLGLCYLEGKGVEVNDKKAVRWLKKAAKNGIPSAAFLLALCGFNEWGTDMSDEKMTKWLKIAAEELDVNFLIKLGNHFLSCKGSSLVFDPDLLEWKGVVTSVLDSKLQD